MKYEEAKALLLDMRAAKRRANAVRERIAELESDRQSIRSSLGGDGLPHGNTLQSRVETMAVRMETEREKYVAALEAYFALEEKLADAIHSLEPLEIEIILGIYVDGKANWQVANDLHYSEVYIRKRKRTAIEKICASL